MKKKASLAKRHLSPRKKRELRARLLEKKRALAKAKTGLAKIKSLDAAGQYKALKLLLDAHYFKKPVGREVKRQVERMGKETVWLSKEVRPLLEKKVKERVFRGTKLSMGLASSLSLPGKARARIKRLAEAEGVSFNRKRMELMIDLGQALRQAGFIVKEKNKLMHSKARPGSQRDLVVRNASDAFGNIMTSVVGFIDMALSTLEKLEARP